MKKRLALLVALSFCTSSAWAQGDFLGAYAGSKIPETHEPIIGVYFDDANAAGSRELANTILKEIEKIRFFDLVHAPADVMRITAPTTVTVPANGKGAMKVGFQVQFPRGNDMDFNVSCEVGKPQDCAKAIRSRLERLYREYVVFK